MATTGPIIAVGTPASGLDIFTRFQGVLTDPTSITFVIDEPGGTSVGSGVGFRRSVGHHDARAVTIPSGFSIADAWKITWTFTSPVGVTSTACQEFCVVDALSPSFDNIGNVKSQVKVDLGLLDDDFTDAELNTLVQKALNRLNRRLCFTGTDKELVFDEGTGTINPTPNSSILDLIVLQVECLIVKRDQRLAVGRGIRVKDGETEIDTSVRFGGHVNIVSDICGELDEAIEEFKAEDDDKVYQTAFECAETIWYGNTNICETLFHNGQGDGRERCEVSPFEVGHGMLTVHM